MRVQRRRIGVSQRSTSLANARWSSCIFTCHIASSSVREKSKDNLEKLIRAMTGRVRRFVWFVASEY